MILIFSNLIVSLSAGILCLGIGKYFSHDLEWQKALFVFCSTLCVYNFQRILKINSNSTLSEQMNWMTEHRFASYTFTLIGAIGSIYLFVSYFFHPYYFLLFIPAGIVCLFYAMQFLRWKNHTISLRELPFIKIILIALIWSVSCFWFPILKTPTISILETILLSLIGFIYVISVTIPFDIRDLKYDSVSQKTIPQILGWKRAKIVSITFLFISFGGLIYLSANLLESIYFWITFMLHFGLLLGVKPSNPNYYFSGFIDGVIATLGIALYLS
ncbi:MAG: hypothetical protein ABI207_05200 [Crocinitomicaceae bacterium]